MATKIYSHVETAVLTDRRGFTTFVQGDAEDMQRVVFCGEDAEDILSFLQGSGSTADVFSRRGEIRLRRNSGATFSQFDAEGWGWQQVTLTNEHAEAIAQTMAAAMS